ncbi:hypothetical protein DV737_g2508, partial [Chaetothyriales sp. CBS 132003]
MTTDQLTKSRSTLASQQSTAILHSVVYSAVAASLVSEKLKMKNSPSLSTAIVAAALLQQLKTSSESTTTPELFILAPPTAENVVGPLHEELQARLLHDVEEQSLSLLATRVHVLQYLDLAGLAEAVGEGEGRQGNTTIVLLIKAISATLAAAQRRSGAVHVAALADSLMRVLASEAKGARR